MIGEIRPGNNCRDAITASRLVYFFFIMFLTGYVNWRCKCSTHFMAKTSVKNAIGACIGCFWLFLIRLHTPPFMGIKQAQNCPGWVL